MPSQLHNKLRAAYRYSSGRARREIARQISDLVQGVRECAGRSSGYVRAAAASEPHRSPQASESPAPSDGASNRGPAISAPAQPAPGATGPVAAGHAWWAQEGRLDRLHDLWEIEGLTASACAAQLGCTKNAVIGMVQRHPALSQRRPSAAAALPARVASLDGLGPNDCRWPHGHYGEPDFHFCCATIAPGRPYCLAHVAIAYIKLAPGRGWTDERREKMAALLKKRGSMPMRGGSGSN